MIDTTSRFNQCSSTFSLQLHQVHVWIADLRCEEAVSDRFRILCPEEKNRANRFVFPHDRDRFVAARAILRILLSHYVSIAPEALKFRYGDSGKPFLDETPNPSTVEFNLSHSGDFALYAITNAAPVGVDIERIKEETDPEEIAARFFSEREIADLNSLPGELRRAAFFRCWTRKEAYIKALGGGLSIPLNQFSVSFLPDEPASIRENCNWQIREIDVDSLYAAAVVAAAPVSEIQLFNFTDLSTELRTESQKI